MLDIKLNRKEFLKKIQIVENAVSDDKSESVNSGIFIEAKDNKIILKGMGEGLFIKAEMPCEIIKEGEFVIRHKLMEEFLKQLDKDEIEIQETEGKINIISGKSSSLFSIYEYTKRNEPQIINGFEYEFDREDLLLDLEKVKFAASTGTEKPAVNCIRLEIDNEGIKLVASDAHRLIYMNKTLENIEDFDNLSVSIPLRSINSLIKIMKSLEGEKVTFKSEGTKVMFKFDDVEIVTNLVEMQYPNYKGLLNSIKNEKRVLVGIKEFTSILKRISVFVKDKNDKKDIAIFNFMSNNILITGSNDLATLEESLNSIYDGKELKILLNVRYVLEYLSTISDEQFLEIKMSDPKTPVILSVEGKENSIYLVAPSQ